MLCEKCGLSEATVKITKITAGHAEVHNFCADCAREGGLLKEGQEPEWNKAIFRLLTEAVRKTVDEVLDKDPEGTEKKKKISCPGCGRTYGEFMEDGIFGCPDCYEAFSPFLETAVRNLQGADRHTGKSPLSENKRAEKSGEELVKETLSPEEEASVLEQQLKEAVAIEDYETAALLRDRIRGLSEAKK